ncbi:uncharacterized protein [Anoplolepis gracilipes]|uniref:uncharacterized protein n=1 Tax=Anoplolepis gracilipes TaxID=354296 RepID=UPI003BA3A346
MSNTTANREASKSEDSNISRQQAVADNINLSQFGDKKPDKQSLFSALNQKIRSKLPTFHNPLKRFIKSKNQREEIDSEVTNHSVIDPSVKKIDELAYLDSGSTLNEQSTAKSNTSIYRSEHHSVAHAARTRESCQDLASYFSEVDPDEPSTSATNTIVLSASTFDRDVEPSETLQSMTMTSTTSTSHESSEITETVSSSMNTEEVSEADFMDALQHGTLVVPIVTPMELALSAQLGNEINSASEIVGSRTQDQRIGRDDPREFYDRNLHVVIRKPICPREDEPSIY